MSSPEAADGQEQDVTKSGLRLVSQRNEDGRFDFFLYPAKKSGWCEVLAASPNAYDTKAESDAAAKALLADRAASLQVARQ